MKLRSTQLKASLDKRLAPAYLITGDEPMQAMLAADAIRTAARAQGYEERQVLDATTGFDWAELRMAAANLSLFAQRRLLDLRMVAAKPGAAGAKALTDYAERPPEDAILLVQTGKLDRTVLNSAWVKALDRIGVVLQIWPLSPRETAQWIQARLTCKGLKANAEAVRLLAERAEGNLLSANQEIEKLSLLYGEAALDAHAVMAAVADSARFSVFDLADAALAGDCPRAVRILYGLAAEDAKPPLVLWSLTEQTRTLAVMSHQISRGASIEQAMQSAQQRRKPLLKRALQRETAAGWQACLSRCARADRIIKGQDFGNSWDELLNLTLDVCGQPLFANVDERV